MFHRLGSLGSIDVYETVSLNGAEWDILFLDLYHPRKSRYTPQGFRMASQAEREGLLFGANEFVASFPDRLQDAIANTYQRLVGVRMRTHGRYERPLGGRRRASGRPSSATWVSYDHA
jgi:hypothetical protein